MPNLARTNIDSRTHGSAGARFAALAGIAVLGGCAGSVPMGPIARDPAPASRRVLDGDWNDVEAAAVVAAAETETVILGRTAPEPGMMVFEIGTIRDEPVEVLARKTGAQAGEGTGQIELTCRYGRFGDSVQQERFLDAMKRRLADLRGVDYRKVR